MAVSTSSYFSNSVQGIPQIGADFNIYDVHTTPRYAIGIKIQRHEGDEYAYSHFGAVVNRGAVCSQDLSESSLVDTDNIVVAPASAQDVTDGTIGSSFIEITLGSVTADQFSGGRLVITDGTGEGYTYRVKGNTATGNPAAGNFRLNIYGKLQVALDATSDIAILGSKYSNLESATTTDLSASGVAVATMASDEYGWVQTAGDVGILQDGAIAIGANAIIGSVAGSVATAIAAGVVQHIAVCKVTGDTTGYGIFTLAL